MNIICVCSPKGGTGKTTTAICLAEAFAMNGKRVLIVDMDKLGTVSKYFLKEVDGKELIESVVIDETLNSDESKISIQHTSNKLIDIIPLETALKADLSYPIGENNLLNNTFVASAEVYDICIIDTSVSDLRFQILISQNLLIVVSDYLSLDGINYLMSELESLNGSDRSACKIRGVLLTMHDRRLIFKRELEHLLADAFGDTLLENVLPLDMNIQKSQIEGLSIYEYSPESQAAVAYIKAAEELMSKWRD